MKKIDDIEKEFQRKCLHNLYVLINNRLKVTSFVKNRIFNDLLMVVLGVVAPITTCSNNNL